LNKGNLVKPLYRKYPLYALQNTLIMTPPSPVIFFDLGNTLVSRINGRYRLYGDAIETLRALRDRGYRLGLLSNLPVETTIEDVYEFLKEYGLASCIEYGLITIPLNCMAIFSSQTGGFSIWPSGNAASLRQEIKPYL